MGVLNGINSCFEIDIGETVVIRLNECPRDHQLRLTQSGQQLSMGLSRPTEMVCHHYLICERFFSAYGHWKESR